MNEVLDFFSVPTLVWGTDKEYEQKWFCDENKIVHHSLNETLYCKHCNSEGVYYEVIKEYFKQRPILIKETNEYYTLKFKNRCTIKVKKQNSPVLKTFQGWLEYVKIVK